MRQIPTSGETCGECPCYGIVQEFNRGTFIKCFLFQESLAGPYRLPSCLRDKPQVLTEEERFEIINKWLKDTLKDMEAHDEHR